MNTALQAQLALVHLARKCPELVGVCLDGIETIADLAASHPAMPPETALDRTPSAVGWYWRPHPDPLRKYTETVWACSRHVPAFQSDAYRAANYRPARADELPHPPVCHYCEV